MERSGIGDNCVYGELRESICTAITGARTHVEIWGTQAVLAEAIQRSSARSSGLREGLWGVR